MFALHLLTIPVSDLAAAKPFWTALLGRAPSHEAPDGRSARYDVDGLDIALAVGSPEGAAPGRDLDFALDHDDLGKIKARLPEGAEARVVESGDGSKRLEARDPDGNRITIVWRMPER